jgi:hypothetical protein
MPRQVIRAFYSTPSSDFVLPKGIKLLSKEVNDKIKTDGVPFSWWIKWDTLHYFDANGKIQDVKPYTSWVDDSETGKYSIDTEFLDTDEACIDIEDDEEDDSNDEEPFDWDNEEHIEYLLKFLNKIYRPNQKYGDCIEECRIIFKEVFNDIVKSKDTSFLLDNESVDAFLKEEILDFRPSDVGGEVIMKSVKKMIKHVEGFL